MPMADSITGLYSEILLHAGFALAAIAFLVRDILWLRLLAIFANLCMVVIGYLVMDFRDSALYWNAALVVINAGHSAILIHERALRRLSEAERGLRELCFQSLDRAAVKALLRRGAWANAVAGEVLATEGAVPERVIAVAEGRATVTVGGQEVATVGPGQFVGEISYLSGRPASATVRSGGHLRYLAWDRQDLDRVLRRRPELKPVLYAAFGNDLARKIASHNVAVVDG